MISKDNTNNAYPYDSLKLSVHFDLGLPLGLFPSIYPTKIFLVVLSRLISSILIFHFSCQLFTISRTPSCRTVSLTSSFLILSNLLTPSILLNTFIYVACIFDCCCFDRLHVSHPCNNVGITVVFTTFSLVLLLSSFLFNTISFITLITRVVIPILASTPYPYSHHY